MFESNDLPTVSLRSLSLANGQDSAHIWIAFKGLVYDVTNSKLWKNGQHYEHWAGQDLTIELKDAPHSASVFSKMKIVGKLES